MSSDLSHLLKKHTCLDASFDESMDADVSRGSGKASAQPAAVHHDANGSFYLDLTWPNNEQIWIA